MLAFLFPGQGSQTAGMGKDLYDNYKAARHVFDTAGERIKTLCFEGPEESLKQTINTQPAVVAMSIAALEALKSELDITPDYTAGHSLGEYCAMYSAGVLSLENTLKLIQKRAQLMSGQAGSMAAVLNADEEVLKKCIEEANKTGYIDIANYNSPSQVVITGDEAAVAKAGELLLANGVKRVIPLAVSGAFHSKCMKEAGENFADFISDIEINNALIPVITNVDAQPTVSAADFRKKMPEQIYSPVYWTQTIQKMVQEGVEIFIEIGPGKVLAGLNKKIAPEAKVYNIYDKLSLENLLEEFKTVKIN
ncbi:MAG: ACP S-malonyltransferase [Heliobacteriaceae bacterium]|jgi:[acyl-carrier-protein] S-malonyltransferase|nr:ACP S-malonyltransferase [Heliobacteriaceae bacterium]